MYIDDKYIETIITSLVYSKRSVRVYPHPDHKTSSDSLRMIDGALEDIRKAKREMK